MRTSSSTDGIPSGFRPLAFREGFIGGNGPIYVDRSGDVPVFGFRVEQRHCNPMDICHGGWIATIMDMVLPLTARILVPDLGDRFLLTVNLTIDYLGAAPLGRWVEGRGQVLKRTGRMVFMQGMLSVDGEAVTRGNGIFRIGPSGPPISDLAVV